MSSLPLYDATVALIYQDDITAFSKFRDVPYHIFWCVLWLHYEAIVSLNLKKRKYFAEMIHYLGNAFWASHPELALHTTDAVMKFKHPTTQTKLRFFLGLCNVFRRFIPNFVCLSVPLTKRLRKDQPEPVPPPRWKLEYPGCVIENGLNNPLRFEVNKRWRPVCIRHRRFWLVRIPTRTGKWK